MNRYFLHLGQSFIVLLFFTFSLTELVIGQQLIKQMNAIPSNFCITPLELTLFKMVNEYRKRFDLPPIPLSKSLCFVATSHVKDLYFNHPDEESCNFHSWSDKGPWKPFCYPRDETKKNSVWDKPKEFTSYKGKGYEIVYWENNAVVIDSVIAFWKSIDYFKDFLMNTGKWQGKSWNSIGVGIYENYACAWFGELTDQEGPPSIRGIKIDAILPDTAYINPVKVKTVKPSKTGVSAAKIKNTDSSTLEMHPIKPERIDGLNGKIYVIVKSQIPPEETHRLLDGIKAKGFPDAKIILLGNKLRISVFESVSKAEAEKRLYEVKKVYKDAWMLKN